MAGFYKRFGKRAIDLTSALCALIILSPLLAVVCAAILVKLGRPVLYMQQRTGRNRRPFWIAKFRSMLDPKTADGTVIADELRLTPFGRCLRATSIDELPSLWNILKGDMSLVGPRPFIHKYNDFYTDEQARRFEVRPGITGWAQVNGRNSLAWEDKFRFDLWYVENYGFLLDLRILCLTVRKVFRRESISADDHATMPEFTGTRKEP